MNRFISGTGFTGRIARQGAGLYLLTFFTLALLTTSLSAQGSVASSAAPKQTFQTCSIIASELLTGMQLLQKGIPLNVLYESLPSLTRAGREHLESTYRQIQKNGLVTTYSAINSRFAKCARTVFSEHGVPPKTSRDSLFYHCAGENKLRYEYILALYANIDKNELLARVHKSKTDLATYMYSLKEKKGIEAVFSFSATELKRCMNQSKAAPLTQNE
ncbi:MAG: hypothetical protein CSB48_11260 [Proteobacteria bacterium]|nr:MAG: hypothetical protein CSB48_11260 [Pseudomonadota bacterium]